MEYIVIKQKRKTASIVITDELEVQVKVPQYMSKKQIERLVAAHSEWINTMLEQKRQLSETKDWYKTKQLLYLGKYWPVELKESVLESPKVDFNDKGFIIVSDGTERCAKEKVEQFFKENAREMLSQLAMQYAHVVGVKFQKITIRKQKTRWGSCSSRGNLSFNLKILCAPVEMIEYVVLHEIMHLKYFNHSMEFWENIEKIMPDYKHRMNYFSQFGQNFMI